MEGFGSFRPKMRCRAGVHPVCAIIAMSCAVVLAGCQRREYVERTPPPEVVVTDNVFVWRDVQTGCEYLIYSRDAGYAGMGGMTARLDPDGRPICKPTTGSATGASRGEAEQASPIPPQGQDQ